MGTVKGAADNRRVPKQGEQEGQLAAWPVMMSHSATPLRSRQYGVRALVFQGAKARPQSAPHHMSVPLRRLWNTKDLAPVQTVAAGSAWTTDVAYLPAARKLLVASMDRSVGLAALQRQEAREEHERSIVRQRTLCSHD